MRLGVRFGPVWMSSGGSRRRKRRHYTAKQGFVVIWLFAVVSLLLAGGWLPALGWTIVAVTVITLLVRLGKHKPGVQHAGPQRSLDDANREPVSARMYHSDRRLAQRPLTPSTQRP